MMAGIPSMRSLTGSSNMKMPGSMKTKFIPTPRLNELVQPELIDEMRRRAEKIAEAAKEIAPEGNAELPGYQTQNRKFGPPGSYKKSIRAISGYDKPGGEAGNERRAVGRVNAFDSKSHWVEFGTEKWQGHGTLQRAAEIAGYRLTKAGQKRLGAR